MRKTIGRNQQKRAEAIFANARNIRSYTLENGFKAEPCERDDYQGRNWMLKEWNDFSFAKLTHRGDNEYHLRVDSNCWYTFTN